MTSSRWGRDRCTQVPRHYVVTGQAINRRHSKLSGVEIDIILYGFGAQVYDTKQLRIGDMYPGETRAFSVRFSNFRELNRIDRYRLLRAISPLTRCGPSLEIAAPRPVLYVDAKTRGIAVVIGRDSLKLFRTYSVVLIALFAASAHRPEQVPVSVKIIEFQTTKGAETGLSAASQHGTRRRANGMLHLSTQ